MLRYGGLSWIAHGAFWVLLAYGWYAGALSLKRSAVFILLWLAACLALPYITPFGLTAVVALLDVAMVFMIFKGDIKLS